MACIFYNMPYVFSDVPLCIRNEGKNVHFVRFATRDKMHILSLVAKRTKSAAKDNSVKCLPGLLAP